jgi:hypothetical protein
VKYDNNLRNLRTITPNQRALHQLPRFQKPRPANLLHLLLIPRRILPPARHTSHALVERLHASLPKDASETTMRNNDAQPPSTARRNAQLRQLIRLAQCPHPQNSLIIRLLAEGGFIEYCSDCFKITFIHDKR